MKRLFRPRDVDTVSQKHKDTSSAFTHTYDKYICKVNTREQTTHPRPILCYTEYRNTIYL